MVRLHVETLSEHVSKLHEQSFTPLHILRRDQRRDYSNYFAGQRKRSAPSWLREKPYIKVRFTQDGVTTKVTESRNLKLTENGDTLKSSLANYSFHVGQIVWCYWKTAHEMEKAYFEGKVIDLWDNALIVEESLPSEDQDEEAVDGTEGKKYFTPQLL